VATANFFETKTIVSALDTNVSISSPATLKRNPERICLANLKQLNHKDREDRKEKSLRGLCGGFVVQIPAQRFSPAPVLQMAKQLQTVVLIAERLSSQIMALRRHLSS
jgi:hypothetical protein